MNSRILMFLTIAFIGIAGCSEKCDDVNCLNGGACNDGSCVCPDGFSGEFCQTADPCADITCQNGGTCLDGTCDCPDGFNGEFCETQELCANVVCENGGTCVNGDCDCTEPYTGTNCQTEVRAAYFGLYQGQQYPAPGACQSFTASMGEDNSSPMHLYLHGICTAQNLTIILSDNLNFTIVPQQVWYAPTSSYVNFSGTGQRDPSTGIITIQFNSPNILVSTANPMVLTPL